MPSASVRIHPVLKDYPWGDTRFIGALLGLDQSGPLAEAWYGAHPDAPSTVGDGSVALDRWISDAPEERLGAALPTGQLPFLLKILAAGNPLSIQVHPNRAQAQAGFRREQLLPADAPRSYRDDNHKPELIVALTEFHALCGFRELEDARARVQPYTQLAALLAAGDDMENVVRQWFEATEGARAGALNELLELVGQSSWSEDQPEYWVLRAHAYLGSGDADPGLAFLFLLDLVRLKPGEGLFLPAGVPHAYLQGSGIEVMASSDNVLRAGLTPKHVDTDELLSIVRFDALRPAVIEPVVGATCDYWPTPVDEFALTRMQVPPRRSLELGGLAGPSILLCGSGRASVFGQNLVAGDAVFLPPGDSGEIQSGDHATEVYRVTCGSDALAPATFRGREPTELAFGTSGLRGLVEDITDLEAWVNTRGFLDYLVAEGQAVPGTPVAIGGDLRPSTHGSERSIVRAVVDAVRSVGMQPIWCGRLPTPALTLFGIARQWPSVMVTGSHIPFDRNGIKFNRPDGEVLKSDEAGILNCVARTRRWVYGMHPEQSPFDDHGWFRQLPIVPDEDPRARDDYRQRYLGALPENVLAGLRLVFFAHSAVGRELIPEVLEALGAEVVVAGRSDTFVAIDTEAIDAERLADLQALADEHGRTGRVDAIVSTDGDSDRPLVAIPDASGTVQFVPGDVLGTLVADWLGAQDVVVPVSSNDLIDRHFAARGVQVERTRIGSPWVIAGMQSAGSSGCCVGWEANGGFLVGSEVELAGGRLAPLPTRDAVLPIVAALAAGRRAGTVLDLIEALPRRYGSAGLLDQIPRETSAAILELLGAGNGWRGARRSADGFDLRVDGQWSPATGVALEFLESLAQRVETLFSSAGFGAVAEFDWLDGARLSFENGDVAHVRPSGNAPQLRIYALSDSSARTEEIVADGVAEPAGLLRRLGVAAEDLGH